MKLFSKTASVCLAVAVPALAVAAVELVEFNDGDVVSAADINANFAALNLELERLSSENEALQQQITDLSDDLSSRVGDATGWISPPLEGDWEDHAAGYIPLSYRRDGFGRVHLRGRATAGDGGVIFNLPTGFRPGGRLTFDAIADGAQARIDIHAGGRVEAIASSSAYTSLDGISFSAEN